MAYPIAITEREHEVYQRLHAWLNVEGKDKFTADDLYRLGLVTLFPDKKDSAGRSLRGKYVGSWFQKMQHISNIRKTGLLLPSQRSTNHGRLIPVWELTQRIP